MSVLQLDKIKCHQKYKFVWLALHLVLSRPVNSHAYTAVSLTIFLTHGLPTSLFWDNIIFDGTLPKPFGHEVTYPESNPGPLAASFVSVVPSIPWLIRVIKERGILLQEGPQIKQDNI